MSKAVTYQQALEIFQAQQTLNPYMNEQDSVWLSWYNGLAASEQRHLSQVAGIVSRVLNEAIQNPIRFTSTDSSELTSEALRRFVPSTFLAAIEVEKANVSFTDQKEDSYTGTSSVEIPNGDHSEQESEDVLEMADWMSKRQRVTKDPLLKQWFEDLPSEDKRVLHDSTEILSELVPKVMGYYISALSVYYGYLTHDFIQEIEPIRSLWKQ